VIKSDEISVGNSEKMTRLTIYKIDNVDVSEKPEVPVMCLKKLVRERGFETSSALIHGFLRTPRMRNGGLVRN
jgi:hypothetical protein